MKSILNQFRVKTSYSEGVLIRKGHIDMPFGEYP